MSNRRYDMKELPETRLEQENNRSLSLISNEEPDPQSALCGHLLTVSTARYESDWHSTMHTHYFTELFYCLDGCGSFQTDEKSFPITADDIVIVSPHVSHTEYSSTEYPLEYVVLGIEGIQFLNKDGLPTRCSHAHYHKERTAMRLYLNTLVHEMQQEFPYRSTLCQHLLSAILIYVLRHSPMQLSVLQNKNVSREISSVKEYIDAQFKLPLTLDDLAASAHLNKYYLVHTFTKNYGLSPINYLLERRVEESKYLLASTDLSITQIAQITGFSSSSYFSQRFRHSAGMSPMSYRRQFTG